MKLDLRTEDLKEANGKKLYVAGEIDAYTAPQLKEALSQLTSRDQGITVVDLEGVDYIDSTGLGIFVGALKDTHSHEGQFKIVSLNSRVKRLFSITGLDEVMDIDEKEEANQ
ncbi:STAS domain-containing protein [Geomicrobium sp. JCM 19055]|uniref:STAS domain-containing protein n=1 Tax=Geomicrobium sp. JCM 19055 TaxID=1460649 RepID=UPI00045ED900|nr:STAS domain-containing protein [Geomicrobium sp. JCM 19055]GAJ99556.1 anti-sigma F factor antagonist [Geomicrobium sp. JCM 19055]